MNSEWSLNALYEGYNSPKFETDRKQLEELIHEYNQFVATIYEGDAKEKLTRLLQYLEGITTLSGKLMMYLELAHSTDTTNAEISSLSGQMEELMSQCSKSDAKATRFIASIQTLAELIDSDAYLKGYEFFLNSQVKQSKHTLSEEVEEVIAKLNQSAASAWSMLQQYVTSTVTVDYLGEELTLSDVRNLSSHPDTAVRKAAYEAELASYEKIKVPVCFSLNNIKSQVNTIAELRGYASPLDLTLSSADLSKDTLDALFTAIEEYLPVFRKYLKEKGKLLGSEHGLAWYDLFAPIGESHMRFTLEEARDLLLDLFGGFSPDLATMVKEAFDQSWIDFYPRKGKVGGAFCENLPMIHQSRILTNFDGTLSSVVTLAHELGHAYHGFLIQDHRPLNTDYSMQLAETASTMNENIVMEAILAKASDGEKLTLLESQLQDVTQIIVDIYSRYLFEKSVFELRKTDFLFPEDLCRLMIEAQKKAYGDGLDESTLHPYMWVCKPHYYDADYNYYNYPYAFGGLFAKGLYEQYKKEGSSFLPKYRSLLHATTVCTSEEVAAMAGIDITKPKFWRQSLQSIADSIEVFLKLIQ